MVKTFDFQAQLKVGTRGEELFLEHYPEPLEVIPIHASDFRVKTTGKIIELKTDTYNINKTSNFFMERWSSVYDERPGGPWQALAHRADIFCYMFVRHNIYYEFNDLPALVKRLEDLTKGKGLVYIKNQTWITGGFKVPRSELEDLYDIWEF